MGMKSTRAITTTSAIVLGLLASSTAWASVTASAERAPRVLLTQTATASPAPCSLAELVRRVKVFKVFGDDDNGGDGSKASGRAKSRSRSASRRSRAARKAPAAAPASKQPAGILLLLDPAFCDQIKM